MYVFTNLLNDAHLSCDALRNATNVQFNLFLYNSRKKKFLIGQSDAFQSTKIAYELYTNVHAQIRFHSPVISDNETVSLLNSVDQ